MQVKEHFTPSDIRSVFFWQVFTKKYFLNIYSPSIQTSRPAYWIRCRLFCSDSTRKSSQAFEAFFSLKKMSIKKLSKNFARKKSDSANDSVFVRGLTLWLIFWRIEFQRVWVYGLRESVGKLMTLGPSVLHLTLYRKLLEFCQPSRHMLKWYIFRCHGFDKLRVLASGSERWQTGPSTE